MCVTSNGIERCDPRDPSRWSSNSSWATIRPSLVGLFTHAVPFTIRGTDTIYPGLIAFQANAHYLITGTDFGADVTAASASTGEDSSIKLLDAKIGTSSPYSVCSVPGVGLFWFTSDLNVYWLPDGALTGLYIGDKIQSTRRTNQGIESTNTAAVNQVWMAYQYPFLMLGIPVGSDTYPSVQWWLDIRRFPKDVVWHGPMTGQTVSRVWVENQNGDRMETIPFTAGKAIVRLEPSSMKCVSRSFSVTRWGSRTRTLPEAIRPTSRPMAHRPDRNISRK
jgi:hypothetical protein